MEHLAAAAESLGVSLDQQQLSRFNRFYELLEGGSRIANLTGVRGWERVREELFIRSLRLLTPAPGGHLSAAQWMNERTMIDVGTGAGIPGLVLKIALPGLALTLLDSNQKKTSFLKAAVDDLELKDVEIVTGRAENVARESRHRERYEVAVSRGVARLCELAELMLPFVMPGGTVIVPKGPDPEEELREGQFAVEEMGGMPPIAQKVTSPGTAASDTIIYILKVRPTPITYPRRVGVPHQRPLLSPKEAG